MNQTTTLETEGMLKNNLSFHNLPYLYEIKETQLLHYQNEHSPLNLSTVLCEDDILEMHTTKLTVLSTISILTLISNGAIMVAILTRNKKVLSHHLYICPILTGLAKFKEGPKPGDCYWVAVTGEECPHTIFLPFIQRLWFDFFCIFFDPTDYLIDITLCCGPCTHFKQLQ